MKKKPGGYSYTVTKAQIRKWQAVPPEDRMQWLEDANRFLHEAMSDEAKKIREAFRRGDI